MDIYDYDVDTTRHLSKGTEVEILGLIQNKDYPGEIVVEVQWKDGNDWVTGKPLLSLFRADAPIGTSPKKGVYFSMEPKALVSASDFYHQHITSHIGH